ncbi:nuclear transport factor 2 family protein [Actinosynnema sp. NPDC020468]|uniref:YybH family protein n=1 Tax=Actinosynnema sp. NPDC020468 TaxID=3154488 RepID=UPI0033D23544
MVDTGLLHELNRDVWHAFRRAYGALDTEAFLDVHSPDLIRAGGPAKQVQSYNEYAMQTAQWFTDSAERGDGLAIEFRFTERIAAGEAASERGVFRITASRGDARKVFHGRFHTFSRRVEGRWRIVVDYDSDEAGTVTAEAFRAAVPVDDVAAFA